MTPKVSYIMSTIRPDFITEAVNSVFSQTLKEWELIIADKNNVLSEVPELMEKIASDPRVTVFDGMQTTEGTIAEKHRATAKSDIILHIHDDDADLPHRAQFLYDSMMRTQADIFVASYQTMSRDGKPAKDIKFWDQFDIKKYHYFNQNMPLFCSAYKKSTCPPFRKSFYVLGDYCFFTDAYLRGLKIVRSPEIVCRRRKWEDQMCGTKKDVRLKVWWDAEKWQFYQVYGVWLNK